MSAASRASRRPNTTLVRPRTCRAPQHAAPPSSDLRDLTSGGGAARAAVRRPTRCSASSPPLRVGITGATGVLGRRLVRRLSAEGNVALRCLVRSPKRASWPHGQGVEVVHGSLAEGLVLETFVRDLDVCIHLASQVENASRAMYLSTNAQGTDALCRTILRANPSCRLVNCSSLAVLKRQERFDWLNTTYANSKYLADCSVERHVARGLRATTVYPGPIYGPEDTKFVPAVARHLRSTHSFLVSGGSLHCPAVYIDDLCDLFRIVTLDATTVGRSFMGVGAQQGGMDALVGLVARRLGVKQPSRRYWKPMLWSAALVGERTCNALGVARAAPLTMRAVDVMSLSVDPAEVERTNRGLWRAVTPMDVGVANAVSWCHQQGLV